MAARLLKQGSKLPQNDYRHYSALRDLVALAESPNWQQRNGRTWHARLHCPRAQVLCKMPIPPGSTVNRSKTDLQNAIGREPRLANDANCFTLSEASDGAARHHDSVFGVILGTGCGGGLVQNKQLINGPRNITGEWGHVPLPWATTDEHPGPACWCGQNGCMETFVSGPAISADHALQTGQTIDTSDLHERALGGDRQALESFARHTSRLARGLAMVVNIYDPDIIVLGGGLSQMPHLYEQLPSAIAPIYLPTINQC